MSVRLKKMIMMGSALAASMALAACGGSSGGGSPSAPAASEITGTVTLQTWSLTPKFTDYLNGVISGFEQKYPGTKVQLVDQPGDGYSEKVLSQAASNNLPDVINLPPDFALPLAQQGLLVDVSKAVPDLETTYVKGAVDAYRFNGVDVSTVCRGT